MEEKKEKKKVDMVAVISVILLTAIICIFNSWLYYSGKIEKLHKNNEVETMMLQSNIDELIEENQSLQLSLDKINSDIQDALERNK